MGGGVAFADLDGDSWEDLLVTHTAHGVLIYRNGGPPGFAFEDVTAAWGLPAVTAQVVGVAAADLDRDGDLEILLAGVEGVRLFENTGAGFVEATERALPRRPGYATSITLGDADADGLLDVYATGYTGFYDWPVHECVPGHFLHNLGDLRFEEVSERWGVVDDGCGLAAVFSDFDDDSDVDLLVANDFGPLVRPSELWRNDGPDGDGGVRFARAGEATGFSRRLYGMGIAPGDANGDESLDYYMTSIGRAVLLLGDGGAFVDGTDAAGVGASFAFERWRATWGAAFVDPDADGRPGLLVASGNVTAADVINTGNVQPQIFFDPVTDDPAEDLGPQAGLLGTEPYRGLAVGDFDRDGDPDLLSAAIGGPVVLRRWDGESSGTLAVSLRGTVSNRHGIGARISISCGDARRVQEVFAGGTYASMHSLRALVPTVCAGPLEVRWPSGVVSRLAVDGPGEVEIVEPAFLEVIPPVVQAGDSATIRFEPRDGAGDLLGSGHDVDVAVFPPGASVSAVTDLGDGSYEAVVTPAAPGRHGIEVTLDGVAIPARPVLTTFDVDRTQVVLSPDRQIPGETQIVATVTPRGPDGAMDGPGHAVVLEVEAAAGGPVADLGDGRYRATLTGSGGDVVVRVTVDGVPRGGAGYSAALAPIDRARSVVRATPAYYRAEDLGIELARILVSPRNGEGTVRDDVHDLDYRLVGGAGEVPLADIDRFRAGTVTLRALAADLESAGPVHIEVDGIRLDTPVEIRAYDEPGELAAFVDPSRSTVGPYFETAVADGTDVAWFAAILRDADGHVVPVPEDAEIRVDEAGFTAIERFDPEVGHVEFRQRVDDVAGVRTARLFLAGMDTGASGAVVLIPQPPRDLEGAGLTLCLNRTTAVAGYPGEIGFRIQPRNVDRFLLGSGLEVVADLDGAPTPASYWGAGEYRGSFPIPEGPVDVVVRAELPHTGAIATRTFVAHASGDVPVPPPEPCVDAWPDAPTDDAGVDAGRDPEVDAGPDASLPRSRTLRPRGSGCRCASAGGADPSAVLAAILVAARSIGPCAPRARRRVRRRRSG